MAEENTKQIETTVDDEKENATPLEKDVNLQPTTENTDEKTEQLIKSDVFHRYYLSNNQYPCEVVVAAFTFPNDTYYPFVKTAPDKSLQSPKYDWSARAWVENNPAEIGRQVVQVNNRINSIADQVENLTLNDQTTAKNNETTNKQIEQMQTMIASSNAMMGQLSGQMAQFGSAINTLASAINNKETNANATDKASTSNENQGKKQETTETSSEKEGE